MKPDQKKFILANLERQSFAEMARHLNIKEKKVRKFAEREQIRGRLNKGNKKELVSLSKKKWILYGALIVLVGIIVYANSLNGQFIWDDERLIQNNPVVKDWTRVTEIFTTTLRTPLAEGTSAFRPLQTFTYLINYTTGKMNVVGYHLTNIIFHILAALTLFWLIQILSPSMFL